MNYRAVFSSVNGGGQDAQKDDILYIYTGCSTEKWTVNLAVNISRQMLIIMVLLVCHYTATCAGVGKTVAGEGRTGLGHPYQLHQSTVSAGV